MGKVMANNITFLLKKTIFKNKIQEIEKSVKFYNEPIVSDQIVINQINKFNYLWGNIQETNSFYKMWKKKHKLPSLITHINDLKNFPPLTKTIINNYYDLIIDNCSNYRTTFTGGTSGETTLFPTDNIEALNAYITAYTGRYWWNIEPLSEILMLWGHSHLFERGVKGVSQKFTRKIKDFLINTKRLSSYELSETNLKYFYDEINRSHPPTIISYSGNIFKLAKFMDENKLNFKFGRLNNIIITSETAYAKDIKLIKKTMAHNVINEYGMAETGVIGYSKNQTQNIKIFWNNFILNENDYSNLFLTTLTKRVFPLINYDTEDKVNSKLTIKGSILVIKEILGKSRNNLPVKLSNGKTATISTIFFDHFLKHIPEIYSVQYLIKKDTVYIILNSRKRVNVNKIYEKCIKEISKNFGIPDRKKLLITQQPSSKTPAGKHSIIIKQ